MPIRSITSWIISVFGKSAYDLSGVKIPIDKSILSRKLIYAIARGKYEQKEATLVKKLVAENDRVLEIGGGTGFVSTLAAKIARKGTVHTVEANPKLIPYISRIHRLNAVRVGVENAIVTGVSQSATTRFYLRDDFWTSSMTPQPGFSSSVDVRCVEIGALVKKIDPKIVIIDIEGGELGLCDAEWTEGIRTAVIEVHPNITGQQGVARIEEYFRARGFSVEFHGKKGDMLVATCLTQS